MTINLNQLKQAVSAIKRNKPLILNLTNQENNHDNQLKPTKTSCFSHQT